MRLAMLFLGQQVQNRMMDQAKRQGVLAYLQVMQTSRRVIVLTLLAFLILQSMVIAGFGALITGFMIWNYEDKLPVLFGIFLGMCLLPLIVLMILASERVWYKATGAQKLVEDLNKKNAA